LMNLLFWLLVRGPRWWWALCLLPPVALGIAIGRRAKRVKRGD